MITIIILILVILVAIRLIFINRDNFINTENFSNSTIIEKIYFINLDSSKDRLNNILNEARKNNLEVERFPAINGNNLDFNLVMVDYYSNT